MRFTWFFSFMVLCVAGAVGNAQAEIDNAQKARMEERRALVNTMMDMTLSVLQDQKKSFADRETSLAEGITDMVDTQWIAQAALGVAWRTATEEQRARYTALYRAYLTKMYISNFAQNAERKVSNMRTLGIDDIDEEKFSVRTEVALSTGERLQVSYLVRQAEGSNQIIDISIEGVSLLVTHRTEFASIVSSSGVIGVIHALESMVNAHAPSLKISGTAPAARHTATLNAM